MALDPIEVTGVFFFGSLILSVGYLSVNKSSRDILKNYGKIIFILILANLVLEFPFGGKYFDGLEYEDSYIYKASARAIHEGGYQNSKINPFYPSSCVYGSLQDCQMSAIFVTNFLGYPYLINLGYQVTGYRPDISNLISWLFSGLSIAFVFIIALLIIDSLLFALICSFIYMTIPIFNVYASTSLTEPLSNAYLALVLLLYLVYSRKENNGRESIYENILGPCAIAFTLIFSILVKTTNVSLVFCLPLAGLISLIVQRNFRGNKQRNKFFGLLSIAIIVFVFSAVVLKFQTAVEVTRGDIGVNPFSFAFFKALAPVFAISFFGFKWYLFYSILFPVGLISGVKKKNGIYPVAIFVFYFVLYTAHYRSYYFTRGIPAAKDEALRYMTSIISVYALIVGLGIYSLWQWIKAIKIIRSHSLMGKSIITTLTVLILATSIVFTLKARALFVEDEQNVRIAPVQKTLGYLKNKDDVIITSEHILFQIYGNSDLNLIDFSSIDNQIPSADIDNLIRIKNVYYLETLDRSGVDEERYQLPYRYIDSKPKECVFSENAFSLYRFLRE